MVVCKRDDVERYDEEQMLTFYFYLQTNVSIDASVAVWIGQRSKLLRSSGDGSRG